jgi:hypothetical protein
MIQFDHYLLRICTFFLPKPLFPGKYLSVFDTSVLQKTFTSCISLQEHSRLLMTREEKGSQLANNGCKLTNMPNPLL